MFGNHWEQYDTLPVLTSCIKFTVTEICDSRKFEGIGIQELQIWASLNDPVTTTEISEKTTMETTLGPDSGSSSRRPLIHQSRKPWMHQSGANELETANLQLKDIKSSLAVNCRPHVVLMTFIFGQNFLQHSRLY